MLTSTASATTTYWNNDDLIQAGYPTALAFVVQDNPLPGTLNVYIDDSSHGTYHHGGPNWGGLLLGNCIFTAGI